MMAAFTGTTYDDLLNWFSGSALENQLKSKYEAKGWDWDARGARPDYERNEAGRYVNESGEELYYWTGPDYDTEYKNKAGLNADADYMTMADIKAAYEEDKLLKQTFESWDQYQSYIVERQDLIDQGIIMDKWERDAQLWNENGGLPGRGPNSDALNAILVEERDRRNNAAYEAQLALNEKYGLNRDIVDDNGNKLVWNGTGYSLVDRYEVDKGKIATGLAAGIIGGGLVGPAIAGKLGGGMLGNAVGAGITNAGTQLLTTGEIDPRSVLSSAVIGGVDPGGMLGDKLGLVPDNVVAGFVKGATNNVIGDAIATGDVDLKDALISGGIGAGVNALTDLVSDSSQFSVEAEMERIRQERINQGLPALTTDELYQEALLGSMTGRSDLGGLVGEDGLLSFIPTVPTGGLNNLLGGGYFDPNAVFIGPDGKEYTDLEVLEKGLSPSDIYSGGVPGWTHTLSDTAGTAINTIENGFLDALAEQEFKNKYGMTPTEALEAGYSAQDILRVISYGPLDETYNWAENPRGTSQYVGLLTGLVDGGYTQGSANDGRPYQKGDGGINDALNITGMQDDANAVGGPSGGSNIIANLGDTGLDPDAVLPGSNSDLIDGLLQGILDGASVSDDSVASSDDLNTSVEVPASTPFDPVVPSDPVVQPDTIVPDTVVQPDAIADNTTPIYNLDINDDGTVTLPGGATVPEAVADSIFEQTYLPSGNDELGGIVATDTLPSGGGGNGGGSGGNNAGSDSGLPPLWGDLDPYTVVKRYKSKRTELVDGMLSALTKKPAVNNFNFVPRTPAEKELFEAGMLS